MATSEKSALRYRPITGWLDPKQKPVAERRSREARHADVQSTQRSRASAPVDVQEQDDQEWEDEERDTRPSRPVRKLTQANPRTLSRIPRVDVRETHPGAFDEEADWDEEEPFPRTQAPRRDLVRAGAHIARQRSAMPVQVRQHTRIKRPWPRLAVLLTLLGMALFVGIYSAAWHVHVQGAQDTVSTRFGSHAPVDTLVLQDQVVFARNNGDAINVYFLPSNSGKGTTLVQTLSKSEWGTPSLVIPSLFLDKGVLYLKLVGVPTYPNWAQPEATYRLQSTADGYQAVPVV